MLDFSKRLTGYRRRVAHEWWQYQQRAAAFRRQKEFEAWLERLSRKPPYVLLGANFAEYGGIRNHLQAILRYSDLEVGLAPDERAIKRIGAHYFQQELAAQFAQFSAPDVKVVHSHVFPWFINWCHARQQDGVRWIHTYHLNYYPEHTKGAMEDWQNDINYALVNVARNASVRLSVSKWQVEELRREHGIDTVYVPNGVDVALCERANGSRFAGRFGLRDFVLYVGRNQPVKNPADFVRLASRISDLDFVMIGNDLSAETLVRDWNLTLPRNLHVLGPLPRVDALDAIAACRVLVVTSKREGLPTLVMEAMAMSKPVVVPDEAGCAETVGHGAAGFVYCRDSMDSLVSKTLESLEEVWIGPRGREKVLDEYDWRVIAPKLDALYGSLMS
jgi:glycosyltransferase involved in cell wall biosynthesis